MKTKKELPECASWNVWLGKEIEGSVDIGELTLFIRNLTFKADSEKAEAIKVGILKLGIKRVWVCADFRQWAQLRLLLPLFEKVCIEVNADFYRMVPLDLLRTSRLYFKIPFPLKDGDFVCVGLPFEDQSFKVGSGIKVNPSQYTKDIKIA